jgi:hypothetical protein
MAGSIGFYAGDGYGWMIGVAAAIMFLVVVAAGNLAILKMSGNLAWTTRFRIIFYIVFMVAVALTRAQSCDAAGACSRMIG